MYIEMVVCGSGSSGNCYLLKGLSESLVIEAGVNFKEVLKGLDFHTANVQGVLVTHIHADHSQFISDFAARGIKVYASEDVFETKQGKDCREAFRRIIKPNQGYKIGGFKVLTMPVLHCDIHGEPVPTLAFVITHPEMGRLLYATDTSGDGLRPVKGLTHIMIEANWSYDIVRELIDSGHAPMAKLKRLPDSHMEITTTIAKLQANDLSEVRDITLIHLSASDADSRDFRDKVMCATGKPTYVATRGLTLDYSL